MKLIFSLLSILLLTACASIDTGLVEFRRADLQGDANSQRMCKGGTGNERCRQVTPATLVRKFRGDPTRQIEKGNYYSIRMDSAFIEHMTELPLPLLRRLNGASPFRWNPFGQNGEIVILARAFEFSETEGDTSAQFLDFGSDTAEESNTFGGFDDAKVVYFSPDVDNGQMLSFSNIPVLGPVEYKGNPIGLQIIVLELDRMSDSVRGLLDKLAALGRTYATPGAPMDLLLSIGSGLLQSASDDIIFEYRMVMDNGDFTPNQIVSNFESGRLVFRRAKLRTDNRHLWDKVILDVNTGKLVTTQTGYEYKADGQDVVEKGDYIEETYFVLNVIDHGEVGPTGVYEMKEWKTLSQEYDNLLESRSVALSTALETEVLNLIHVRKSLQKSAEIGDSLDSAAREWRSFKSRYISSFTVPNSETVCKATLDEVKTPASELSATRSEAIYELNRFLIDLSALAGELASKKDAEQEKIFRMKEKDTLIKRLRGFIFKDMAISDDEMSDSLKDFETFHTTFAADENMRKAFIDRIEAAAKAGSPQDCKELEARFPIIWAKHPQDRGS